MKLWSKFFLITADDGKNYNTKLSSHLRISYSFSHLGIASHDRKNLVALGFPYIDIYHSLCIYFS